MLERLVLASHNKKKAGELRAILEPLGVHLLGLSDFPGAPEPVEDGDSFEANALIKACSALAHTGEAAVADDSGLMVDALDGAPGVYSARFAGEDADDAANNALLLEKLSGVPPEKRGAKFVSVVALALPGGESALFRGETHGTILDSPRGAGGFGYDPLFLSLDLGVSFAEADPEAKNRISHRARALAGLLEWLERR
ncbi:MAG: RdgB/HAM1 family non-canonical purine NTP pyrophosphatase [Planctomycetota bacterium]|nr:RdgB/HAM1 family non-canonical purine NTP pyrophosphatase [Planctomycetota bacterium]